MENDCTGPNFILENSIQQLTDSLQNKPFDEENIEMNAAILEEENSPQCTGSFDPSTYENIMDDALEQQILGDEQAVRENVCTSLDLGSNVGNIADEVDRVNRRKRRLGDTANYEEFNEWETTTKFK